MSKLLLINSLHEILISVNCHDDGLNINIVSVASEETAFLLGTCYYRAGRVNEAHHLLQNISLTLPQARFLLAKCSVELKS